MCHRSVGLIQNVFEQKGIPTVSISTKPEITMGVGVPRGGYVRFPLGNPFGQPFDEDLQKGVLVDLLSILALADEPGSVYELPYRWRRGRVNGS